MKRIIQVLAVLLMAVVILLALPVQTFASVSFGGASNATFTTTTAATNTGITVSGSNTCILAVLQSGGLMSSPSVNWDSTGTPQAMTSIGTCSSCGVGRIDVFLLINPHAGNKTMAASWTTNDTGSLGAVFFTGADQSTCINLADNVGTGPSSSSPISQTINSAATDATVSFGVSNSGPFTSMTQTQLWLSNLSSASYALGGTTNTHSFSFTGSSNYFLSGWHILAAAGGVTKGNCVGCGVF